jgi:hypothetical protein
MHPMHPANRPRQPVERKTTPPPPPAPLDKCSFCIYDGDAVSEYCKHHVANPDPTIERRRKPYTPPAIISDLELIEGEDEPVVTADANEERADLDVIGDPSEEG